MHKPTDETKQTVQDLTQDFLDRLQIAGTIMVNTDETDAYRVHIQTEETGLLIGFHGKTLESFQMLLSAIISKKIGEWARVYVNVGDYRERREENLMYMAQRAADRALESGRAIELPRLSASERRVVHLTLSGDDRVETESVGEGNQRILLVKPKALAE